MSEKRRDNKNRILRNGESQRKDGRYAFKYTDANGHTQFVYSWKLETTDKLPGGKRECLALREKEKQIVRDLDDHIVPRGGEMTVLQLVQKYVLQKAGVGITRRRVIGRSSTFSKRNRSAADALTV